MKFMKRVIISYEIYETSLRRDSEISHEMITSVRFCLSYDPLKWIFIAFRMNIISSRKRIVDMDAVNDVMYVRQGIFTHVVM